MSKFKDLKVWQKAILHVTKIYTETASFPKEETYGITSQIRRCSVSIPSNIAELDEIQKMITGLQRSLSLN